MTKTYKPKKDLLVSAVLIFTVIFPMVVISADYNKALQNPWEFLPLLLPFALIAWLYFDTSYKIEGNYLHYRSAFLRGKIDISTIRKIEKNKTMWVGIKPALATRGLVISYNKYDEIYIAPLSNTELVNDLLKVNPEIQIF
jgi:hypothetical protein